MSNLIPERRADKRGNIVTRWVRSFKKKPTQSLPAPWPSLAMPDLKGNPLRAEITRLCHVLQPSELLTPSSLLTSNVAYIAKRDPELLERITVASESDSEERDYWEHRLGRGPNLTNKSRNEQRYTISGLKNAFVIHSVLQRIADSGGDITPSGKDRMGMDAMVNGIILTDGEITDPPEQLVEAVTLIAYIKGLHTPDSWDHEDGGYMTFAGISSDAGYIGGRLDEVEAMLPELRARKAFDRATIEALRDSPSQVMRDGEL